jgi:glycosyltransferase involved in cell wall biosynthesis
VLAKVLPNRRVLHITHAFGGGTQRYVRDMARLYRDAGCSGAQLAFDVDGNATLAVDTRGSGMEGLFAGEHRERYSAEEQDLLLDHLELFGFEKIHLHAPFGMRNDILDWVAGQVFDATIHDYAWICPRVTLSTPLSGYCGQPGLDACRQCTMTHGVHPGMESMFQLLGADVGRYRDYNAALLERAQCVYVGGEDVAIRMRAAGVQANYRVRPHPNPATEARPRRRIAASTGDPIQVALIGGISPIKGASVLAECAREAHARRLPIEFIVFGSTADDVGSQPNVHVLGAYEEEDLLGLLETYSPDVAFFPNQWPETFSYTLSAAMAGGIWPVVTDIGVPAERVRESGFGDVVPLDSEAESMLKAIADAARRVRTTGAAPIGVPSAPSSLSQYEDANWGSDVSEIVPSRV